MLRNYVPAGSEEGLHRTGVVERGKIVPPNQVGGDNILLNSDICRHAAHSLESGGPPMRFQPE